jgi:hypothetical protein
MTNKEIISKVTEVLDAIELPYQESIKEEVAIYREKQTGFDGRERNTYTLGFYQENGDIAPPELLFAILDAATEKVVFIGGPMGHLVVNYAADGTITAEPEK